MDDDRYLTVDGPAEAASRERSSKFLAYIYPVRTEGEIRDGEPSGTAGKPILGQLLSAGITDCLVAVVRYFGGTKLGVPGLIAAYRESAAAAIAAARIVERTVDREIRVRFPYVAMNDIMRVVKEEQPRIGEQTFDNLCTMRLTIRESRAGRLAERLEKAGGSIGGDTTTPGREAAGKKL